MYPVGHPKGPTSGLDVKIAKFAVHRYETNLLPKPVTGFTPQFGPALKEALAKVIQPAEGIPATGNIGQATWDVLWLYLDDYRRRQYRLWELPTIPKPNPVPDLGSICPGDPSLLSLALTHNSDGVPGFPAVDTGWIIGRTVLAVEDLIVFDQSSSHGGDAFYARGDSKLEYWYAHLAAAPPTGARFEKGEPVGKIASMPRAHSHLGVNARPLIGRGLLYGRDGDGPDYTFGAATVGAQLSEALSF